MQCQQTCKIGEGKKKKPKLAWLLPIEICSKSITTAHDEGTLLSSLIMNSCIFHHVPPFLFGWTGMGGGSPLYDVYSGLLQTDWLWNLNWQTGFLGLCGEKVDAIDHQTAEIERLSKEVMLLMLWYFSWLEKFSDYFVVDLTICLGCTLHVGICITSLILLFQCL